MPSLLWAEVEHDPRLVATWVAAKARDAQQLRDEMNRKK